MFWPSQNILWSVRYCVVNSFVVFAKNIQVFEAERDPWVVVFFLLKKSLSLVQSLNQYLVLLPRWKLQFWIMDWICKGI